MTNRKSKKNAADYVIAHNTHGRTNNSWQRFRWIEKEGALELVRDGRRMDVYGSFDTENNNVEYRPADSKKATQKWKLVYAENMEKMKTKGEANGFKIEEPFYIQTQFGTGTMRRVIQCHGHNHIRVNTLAKMRNNKA
jgi:hypothetical protein